MTIIALNLVTLFCIAQVWLKCSTNLPMWWVCWTKAHFKLQLKVWPNVWQSLLWLWSHFSAWLKSDLVVQETHLCCGFVEQKLILSCSLRCDQMYDNHCSDFGHTLLGSSSLTLMFNKHNSVVGLLNKSSCLAAALKCDKIALFVLLRFNLDIQQADLILNKVKTILKSWMSIAIIIPPFSTWD